MGAFDLSRLLYPDSEQGRQPQYVAEISKTIPIARGIVLAENLRYRQSAIGGQPNTLFGTTGITGRGGVGVSFGAAESIACPIIPDSIKRTILIVAVAKGSGAGGSLGRMYDTRNTGLLGYSAWRDDSANQESFNRGWSAANGQWYWTAAPSGQLFALAIAYDGSSAANVPIVVRNGKQQAISVNTNPSGTINTVTDPFFLGNRRSDNARNWSGEEYLFVVWDRLLSIDDQIWVTSDGNYNQLLVPQGLGDATAWLISAGGGTSTSLAIDDATHAHLADAITLGTNNATTLVTQETLHAHTTDPIALTSNSLLAVADATHAHLADAISLSTNAFLTIAKTWHTHMADAITLGTNNATTLVTQETLHAHAADSIALTSNSLLAVADATHAHLADAISLSTNAFLSVAKAWHTHLADAITLSTNNAITLVPADASHAHAIDPIALTTTQWLAVADALHGHLSDNVGLTSRHLLTIAEATHAHLADLVALSFGDIPEPWAEILTVPGRILLLEPAARVAVISAAVRRLILKV